MRSLGILAATILLLAGCSQVGAVQTATPGGAAVDPTSTLPAPPEAWLNGVCRALLDLQLGIRALDEAYDDATNFDFDTAKEGATEASSRAKSATSRLADLPAWAPGKSAVVYLNGAATANRKAANLLKIGLDETDVEAITEANKQIDVGTAQLRRASTAIDALRAKYDVTCD